MSRLSARNRPFDCTDVNVGDSALVYKSASRKGPPRRRGPGVGPDIDETGVTVTFWGQTFKVARNYLRRKVAPENVGEVEWNPASGGMGVLGGLPPSALGKKNGLVGSHFSETGTVSPDLDTERNGGVKSSSSAPVVHLRTFESHHLAPCRLQCLRTIGTNYTHYASPRWGRRVIMIT